MEGKEKHVVPAGWWRWSWRWAGWPRGSSPPSPVLPAGNCFSTGPAIGRIRGSYLGLTNSERNKREELRNNIHNTWRLATTDTGGMVGKGNNSKRLCLSPQCHKRDVYARKSSWGRNLMQRIRDTTPLTASETLTWGFSSIRLTPSTRWDRNFALSALLKRDLRTEAICTKHDKT